MPHVRGNELIKIDGTCARGIWLARIPVVILTTRFRFRDDDVLVTPTLDTILADCDADELVLTWRASVPLDNKPEKLRAIEIFGPHDPPHRSTPFRTTRGKPHFRGLAACLAWLKQRAEDP